MIDRFLSNHTLFLKIFSSKFEISNSLPRHKCPVTVTPHASRNASYSSCRCGPFNLCLRRPCLVAHSFQGQEAVRETARSKMPVKSSLSGALTTVTSMRNKFAFRSQLLVTHFISIEISKKALLSYPTLFRNEFRELLMKAKTREGAGMTRDGLWRAYHSRGALCAPPTWLAL